MRVLVTYASVGAGHFTAARAIYNYFKSRDPAGNIRLINILDYTPAWFRRFYCGGYNFFVNSAAWAWALIFYATYLKPLRNFINYSDALFTRRFTEFLIQENPDFIISSHFLASQLCAALIRKGIINAKLITLITDFGVHPYWIAEGTWLYAVAGTHAQEKLLTSGINNSKVRVTGIPIDAKFMAKYDRRSIAHKLNLDPDKFTSLIVTGSFGIGPIAKIAGILQQAMQVLVVCAKNNKLFKKLKNSNVANVRVFGFVDNIEELMSMSDVLITKPGGLTIAEALGIELVPVFIKGIPGQEASNLRILAKAGIGVRPGSLKELQYTILDYKENPHKLELIRDKIRAIKKTEAAKEIYDVVCQSSNRPAN
ncbi:MAG: glycosyltransferase [Candidatus Omnitrophota bacterium]